jgi:hypothetical protein
MSTARQLVESAYFNDQRVLYNADETVTVPGQPGEGDWHIEPVDGGWTVRNDGDQGFVTTNVAPYDPRVFATLDGALFYMIGDPK